MDVVKLVNEVASIVHESVVNNLGAPNKNIGDAFLVESCFFVFHS